MPKFIFIYDPNQGGAALLDSQVKGYAEMIIAAAMISDGCIITLSNQTVIQYIRLAILEGKLDPKEVVFKYGEETFEVNSYGSISNWYEVVKDESFELSSKILQLQLSLRQKEKASKGITLK